MTCSCNDTHRVMADRDERTVEAACARCTAARLAALEAAMAALTKRLDDKDGAR